MSDGMTIDVERRERLERDFASAFIHIRGAHNPNPGEPCTWCWLAAQQAVEAMMTTDPLRRLIPASQETALREALDRIGEVLTDPSTGENIGWFVRRAALAPKETDHEQWTDRRQETAPVGDRQGPDDLDDLREGLGKIGLSITRILREYTDD